MTGDGYGLGGGGDGCTSPEGGLLAGVLMGRDEGGRMRDEGKAGNEYDA